MKKGLWIRLLTIGMLTLLAAGTALAQEPASSRGQRAEVRFLEGMMDHHQMALDMAQDCLAKAESETVLTLCQNVIDAQSAEIAVMQGWLLDWYGIDYAPMPMSGMMGDGAMSGMMPGMEATSEPGAMGAMMGDMDMHAQLTEMQGMMQTMMGHMDAMRETMSEMMAHMDEMRGMMGATGDMGSMMDGMNHDADEPASGDPPMMMGMMAGLNRVEGPDYEVAWLESMIDHHGDALHMAERILALAEHDELRTLAETIIADQTAEIEYMEDLLAAYDN